jgi:anti-sigma factor RsiW
MSDPRRLNETELHAFVDGELTGEERAEVEALLAASPAEQALARELHDLNGALAARYAGRLAEPVPAAMLQTVAHLAESDTAAAPSTRSRVRWMPLAASLLLAIMAGIGGYLLRGLEIDARRPGAQFVATAISAHAVYLPEVRHPVEVGASEEAHLVQWLTKRIGADVRAPTLGGLGWKLVGGRLLPDQGLPAAQFMYEDATGRRLTLYLRKESGLGDTSFRFYERDGFGAFYWIDHPLAYALSGRLGRDELMALANTVYAQLEALSAAKDGRAPPPRSP